MYTYIYIYIHMFVFPSGLVDYMHGCVWLSVLLALLCYIIVCYAIL